MISLHFDEADLDLVVRALADVAKINVVIAQDVKAKVTLWIDRVPGSEAFPILQAILETNNLTVIKAGPVYKIVSAAAIAQQSAPIGFGRDEAPAGDEGFLTQIIPLQYLSAEELVKVAQPLAVPGRVLPYRETNSLILSAPTATVKRILQIIQTLDVPGRQREAQQTFVYYVENAKARELGELLSSVFEEKRRERAAPVRPSPPPTLLGVPPPAPPRPGVAAPPTPEPAPPTGAPPLPGEEGRIVGEVRIVADEPLNALIIRATAQDYRVIEETIKKLDITPKQVLIEVLIAEVTLTDNFSFGIEWFLKAGDVALAQFFGLSRIPNLLPNVTPARGGFTLTYVDQDKFRLFLNSLSQYTKINTLATPHILTLNNKAAKLQVGQEVPVVTGSQATVTGQPTDQAFQTIQQKDIGRILGIKPHVNEKRQVTLDLQLEVIDTLPNSTVQGTPSFLKRTAQTSAVVEDGQSLLIGGIISSVTSADRSGFPWLSKIPILGYLFSQTTESTIRTELFIMLTPHVVASPEEGRVLTEEFRQRLDWMEKGLQEVGAQEKPWYKP